MVKVNIVSSRPLKNYGLFVSKLFATLNREGLDLDKVQLIFNYNMKKVANEFKRNTGVQISFRNKFHKNSDIAILFVEEGKKINAKFKGKVYQYTFKRESIGGYERC